MNWYKTSQLNELLTSSYYSSDEEDERAIDSLRKRYKRVNMFLERQDIDQSFRKKLEVLRNWLTQELRNIYSTIRLQRESIRR